MGDDRWQQSGACGVVLSSGGNHGLSKIEISSKINSRFGFGVNTHICSNINLSLQGALFESPHEDENDVQTISHRCEVLQFVNYFDKFGADSKQYQTIYDNNDTYYLAGHYNPRLQVLKLQDDIPTLEELQDTTTTTTTTED